MSGTPSFAGGDFSGDGRADLVAVNTQSMRRFIGSATGDGTFSGMTTVTTTPGPGGGIPVIFGRTVAVANTRLRLYDQRCTSAPSGFPVNETFVAGGLCASVALPNAVNARQVVTATVGARKFILTLNGTMVGLFEIVETSGGATVNAVPRFSTTMNDILQIAWSQADGVFVFSSLNSLQVRRLTVGSPSTASLTTVAGLGTFTVDLAPERGTLLGMAIGELRPGERSVIMTEQKSEKLKVLPFSTTTGWNRQGMVETVIGVDDDEEERASRIVVGQFNDDDDDGDIDAEDRRDIALLEQKTGNVIIVRQQPDPCISFITSSSQGHLAFPENYSPIARFNRRLVKEVADANAARRPASGFRDNMLFDNAAQCPARFVDVRGHWEEMSSEGSALIVVSRLGWVGSSYAVWVPSDFYLPIPSLPAFTPIDYWASAGWVLAVDIPAITRFVTAGIAAGTEAIARSQASSASVRASRELNERLREAVSDANARMNRCTGTIYVDLIGHSRGGPMVTQALRRGFGARGHYNFEVSTTLLDVVDPSPGGSAYPWSNVRPWIRAGYIPGDPVITRVGSEWNSSFYGDDSSGEVPPWILWNLEGLLALNDTAGFLPEVFRAEVIGLPVGYNRRPILEHPARSFDAYQGPIEPVQHKAFLGARLPTPEAMEADVGFIWVNPDEDSDDDNNIFAPNGGLSNADRFAFVSATHLGGFLADPRAFDGSNAVGFHTTPDFDNDDEARCFPADGCDPTPGGCADRVTDALGRESERHDGEGIVVRELVPGFDFRIATGIVKNAKTIIDGPPLKDQLPGAELLGLRTFIETTASGGWVADGTWKRDSGSVTLPAVIASAEAQMTPYIADPTVDYDDVDTTAEIAADVQRWSDELDTLGGQGSTFDDRVSTLADAAARTTDATVDPWVQFTTKATISAQLRAASIAAENFLVRVEFEGTGKISVGLSGPSLSGSATWTSGAGRMVGQVFVNRSAVVTSGIDVVSITASNARVYSVSVRPAKPYEIGDDLFEFVSLDLGVTKATAERLAARARYNGVAGRLARVDSTTTLDKMRMGLAPDVAGWIDGSSASGASGSFKDSNGSIIATALFASDVSFTAQRPRGAHVYTDTDHPLLRLGHTHPGTNVDGRRAGFWIEYPGAGAFARSTSDAGMFGQLASFFETIMGDDEVAVDDDAVVPTDDAVAECLSPESLSCFLAAAAP